jgi:hypothetical protein
MTKGYIYILSFTVLAFSFVSCNKAAELFEQPMEFLEQPAHKNIIISDSNAEGSVQIKNINNKVILLSLLGSMPENPATLKKSDLLNSNSIYTIGKVSKNRIVLKLYNRSVEYWTGRGSYYVVFLTSDEQDANKSTGYVSTGAHSFNASNTYLNNGDFLPLGTLDINITSSLPF